MAKLIQIALIVAFAAVCCAEPARLRNSKQSRFFARQELAEDIPSQTPYPPAGIVPEVRFDLPTEQESAVEPDNTYLPPDNAGGVPAKTYGPPEAADDDVDEEEVEADQPQQPEDLEQAQAPEQDPLNDDEAENNEIENPLSERIVLRRRSNLRSAKLQARPVAKAVAPVKFQRLVAQPIPLRSQPLLAQPFYFADGSLFAYNPQFLRV